MNLKCAIVIPVYRAKINGNENISLSRIKEVFGNKYEIILVYPAGLDISEYAKYQTITNFLPLEKQHFDSLIAYSNLMMKAYFYKQFLAFEYILIAQLDTFIFENNLNEWCNSGYDFIGAPWIDAAWIGELKQKYFWIDKVVNPVGNGGLSLRRVKKFYWGCILLKPILWIWKTKWHEDMFWGTVAGRILPFFKVPNVKIALKFAMEENPRKCYELNDYKLPFGCHAWEKFEPVFWAMHLKEYGYMI
jgi:Protein of unknown function (DUF5672)